MKIKFGSFIVDGRGKIGGHVASKNREGAYLRTKVTPINRNSPFQRLARERLATISQSWNGITEEQRQAWRNAVTAFRRSDIFGDVRIPSGFNLFQRLNNQLQSVGVGNIVDPPTSLELPEILFSGLAISTTDDTIVATPSVAAPAGIGLKIFATRGISQGVTYVSNEFKHIGSLLTFTASPISLQDLYVARYGAVQPGQRYFFQFRLIGLTTGIVSQAQQLSAVPTST